MNTNATPATSRLQSDLTRRKFLRNSTITASALSYSRIAARAAGKEDSAAINIALVGCGQQGMAALTASTVRIPGVRFAAVCDLWDQKRISAKRSIDPAGKVGTQDFAEMSEMLAKVKEVDAVLIATPDWLHAPYSRQALEAGKHVYCEKMMSNSIEAAADMVKAQRQTGKLLQIGHQRRSNPRYRFMRDQLLREKRLLGQVTHLYGQWNRSVKNPLLPKVGAAEVEKFKKAGYANLFEFANWRWFKKYGGGPISDLGAHQIDIFNWILGTTPKSLTAAGGLDYYKNRDLPDGTKFSYEHLDNAVHNQVYREKDTTEDKVGAWETLAKQGFLRKPPATVYNKFWERPKLWNRPDPWLEKEGVQDVRVSIPADPYELPALPKELDEKPPHQHHLENFFNVVRAAGPQSDLACPVEEAYKCCRAVLAINDAVAQAKRIDFKPEDFTVA